MTAFSAWLAPLMASVAGLLLFALIFARWKGNSISTGGALVGAGLTVLICVGFLFAPRALQIELEPVLARTREKSAQVLDSVGVLAMFVGLGLLVWGGLGGILLRCFAARLLKVRDMTFPAAAGIMTIVCVVTALLTLVATKSLQDRSSSGLGYVVFRSLVAIRRFIDRLGEIIHEGDVSAIANFFAWPLAIIMLALLLQWKYRSGFWRSLGVSALTLVVLTGLVWGGFQAVSWAANLLS